MYPFTICTKDRLVLSVIVAHSSRRSLMSQGFFPGSQRISSSSSSLRGSRWVAVPMVTVRCSNHGMCTRTYMPLSLAFGKTIHSFQGASVGPTPKGRPDNPFLRIVADPGTRKFESTNTGMFYTLLSRVTSMGDMKDPTTSSIFFTGANMSHDRVDKINRRKDKGKYGDYYQRVKDLKKWVQYLDQHSMKRASDTDVQNIVAWTKKTMQDPINQKEYAAWVKDHARM